MAEEGDEFGHRIVHRADPVFDSGLELGAPHAGGQSPEGCDQVIGQRVAHPGEPPVAVALLGRGPDIAGRQEANPHVEGEFPEQRGIDEIGHPNTSKKW